MFNPIKKANFFLAWLIVFFYLFITIATYLILLKPDEKANVIYIPKWIKEIGSKDKDYTESFYLNDKTIVAYFFNVSNKKWYRDLYSNEILLKTDEQLEFNNGLHSPFVPLPNRLDDTVFIKKNSQPIKSSFQVTNDLFYIHSSPSHAPGALFSQDDEGIYNVQYTNGFYQLFYFDVKKRVNQIMNSPFNKGHVYSPFYWKAADILFYFGIYRKDKKFQTALYIQRENHPSITKVISWETNLEIPIIKISGNSSGKLFLHTHPQKKYPTLSDMRYYPFPFDSIEEKGIYALGYEIKFLELDSVYSFNFHPHHPQKLLVVGTKKGYFNNGLFLFELRPKSISNRNSKWAEGVIYILLTLLVFFLYKALNKLNN